MEFKVSVATTFHCSLERAFKTPMLCDIAKVHTGFGFMPKVTHCTNDENWGKVGVSKKVFAAKSFFHKGGFISSDKVVDRIENEYWKIEVANFQSWILGFSRFTGEWQTTEIGKNEIAVLYTYTLHAENQWLYPLNWLFARLFWKKYMHLVLENVRQLAYQNEPCLFD